MTIIYKRVARVKSNGKRYFVVMTTGGKVYCKGEVLSRGGFAASFGKDKTFKADKVDISEIELTEDLLDELIAQEQPPLKVERAEKKFAKREGRSWTLTEYGRKQLVLEGEDMAWDGIGNYLGESEMATAAYEVAEFHSGLTDSGVPEGMSQIRECAADYIYQGMLKALERARAVGRKTTV